MKGTTYSQDNWETLQKYLEDNNIKMFKITGIYKKRTRWEKAQHKSKHSWKSLFKIYDIVDIMTKGELISALKHGKKIGMLQKTGQMWIYQNNGEESCE